jgi:gliding motility-associated protein GldC
MKTAEIKLTVQLDDNNVPENILWESTDSQEKEALPVKSMMLSLWDQSYKNTLRIDLWTKDMPVDEMKRFFYETLQTMGDSFLRATGEKNIVEDLRDYCAHFADKMEIKKITYAPASLLSLIGFIILIAATYCPMLRAFGHLTNWNVYKLNQPYGLVLCW